MKCLNAVLEGGTYFPGLKAKVIGQDGSIFTPREVDVIKLVLDGRTSAEIASQLNLSQATVDTHRKNIGRKARANTPLGLNKFIQDNKIKL
jgi:DNA-binding NarL/FixJ family response regulator